MTFYEKVKNLCEIKGISITALAMELGFSKSAPTTWKNSDNLPRAATVKKIADFFGLTVGELKIDIESAIDFNNIDTSDFDQPAWRHFLEQNNYDVRKAYTAYVAFEHSKIADALSENSRNTINGNNNIIGNGNSVGENLSEQEKALFDIFKNLDIVKQAQLLSFAAELSKE